MLSAVKLHACLIVRQDKEGVATYPGLAGQKLQTRRVSVKHSVSPGDVTLPKMKKASIASDAVQVREYDSMVIRFAIAENYAGKAAYDRAVANPWRGFLEWLAATHGAEAWKGFRDSFHAGTEKRNGNSKLSVSVRIEKDLYKRIVSTSGRRGCFVDAIGGALGATVDPWYVEFIDLVPGEAPDAYLA